MPKKTKNIYKIGKDEEITYVDVISVFILVLLTAFVLVLAGVGFMLSDQYFLQVLTNIIMVFFLAEGVVIIMLLYRIYRRIKK
jgi:hypothetical protein